jgi:hypothetical protein
MPGVPMHILMADLAADALIEAADGPVKAVIDGNRKMYHLGAAGPDLALFAPDFGEWAVELVRQLAELHDEFIKPIVDLHEKYIAPVTDAIGAITGAAETALDAATCGLIGDFQVELQAVSQRISGIVQAGLGSIAVTHINIFDKMTPPIQDGATIDEWFWFDTLHNRRTGRFLEEMWKLAQTDAQKAYVLGYASHFAGDMVGHQFVNTVVGSPARARLQRHHFAENIIDTHIFDLVRGSEVSDSHIHLGLPHGNEVENEPSLRALVDRLNDVPPDMVEIFQMLSMAMEATFNNVPHPQRLDSEYLTVENLNVAFWLLLTAMRASTAAYIPPPTPLSDQALERAMDAIKDFLQTATNPPSPSLSLPDMCAALWSDSCNFSMQALKDWADAVRDALEYLLEVLAWVGSLIHDLWQAMACTVTAPIKAGLQAGFYLAHSVLHEALERVREVMVQAAAIYPTREWVKANPLAQSFLVINRQQSVESAERIYPHRAAESNAGFQSYPQTPTEKPATWASGFDTGVKVEQIVSDFPVAPDQVQAFGQAPTPQASRDLAEQLHETPLGSVVPYTTMVQRQLWSGAARDIPDFSLDADRGLAHRNWLIEPGSESSVMHNSTLTVDYDWAE